MPRVFVIMLLCCAGAWGDVVWTTSERLVGDMKVKSGAVEVRGKDVAWDQVVLISREAKETISGSHVLRLRSGERWVGEFLRFGAKKVRFASPVIGEREVDVALVAGVDFVGKAEAGGAPATLYRTVGEPLPGELLWVNSQQLSIQSPLGAVTLQREGAIRYNFPAGKDASGGGDVVTLVDGTVLKGTCVAGDGRVGVTHAVLGEVVVPAGVVKSVHRVAPLEGVTVTRKSLLGGGEKAVQWSGELQPGDTAAFEAPVGVVRMFLEPIDGGRADVKVKVSSGGKVIFEKLVTAGEIVSGDSAGEVTIEVSFAGGKTLFPAGVAVGDPHVVSKR